MVEVEDDGNLSLYKEYIVVTLTKMENVKMENKKRASLDGKKMNIIYIESEACVEIWACSSWRSGARDLRLIKNRYRWSYGKEDKIEKGTGTKEQPKEWWQAKVNVKEPWKLVEK